MQYRTLGRTGLKVSLLGLGSGGASRLGQRYNLSTGETERLVKQALEAGVNVIDTAPGYGITEHYQSDHKHATPQAICDCGFDVIMVGFNLLSPAAITTLLPLASARVVGIVVMRAVRSVLVNPSAVRGYIYQWRQEGLLQPDAVQPDAPLDWLPDEHTPSISAAAYKFAAGHPVGSVLTGTASLEHFDVNLQAMLGPPLSAAKVQRIQDVFGPVERNVQPERVRG